MAIFPRPASPRNAAGDLWSYLKEKRSHKWPLLGLSAALTWVIIWAFMVDAKDISQPQRNKIVYFESWNANRSDAQIILQQKLDVADYEIALRKKQKEMQKLADIFGIEWRKDAERNNARRTKALKRINADLDKELAEAEAKEGKDAADTGKVVPIVRLPGEDTAPKAPASATVPAVTPGKTAAKAPLPSESPSSEGSQ